MCLVPLVCSFSRQSIQLSFFFSSFFSRSCVYVILYIVSRCGKVGVDVRETLLDDGGDYSHVKAAAPTHSSRHVMHPHPPTHPSTPPNTPTVYLHTQATPTHSHTHTGTCLFGPDSWFCRFPTTLPLQHRDNFLANLDVMTMKKEKIIFETKLMNQNYFHNEQHSTPGEAQIPVAKANHCTSLLFTLCGVCFQKASVSFFI